MMNRRKSFSKPGRLQMTKVQAEFGVGCLSTPVPGLECSIEEQNTLSEVSGTALPPELNSHVLKVGHANKPNGGERW